MKRYVSTIPESNTKRPAYERANLVNDLRNEIQKHQDNLRNHLAELFFLHNEGNLLDINLWTNQSNAFLENYIQQIKCASTDALPDLLEQVPTGHAMPKVEVKKEEHSSTPFMSSMAALSEGVVMEKAKHEALIVQQVAVLKQQGMWSLKRLPKVKEPDKIKCHWDYLLEEMQWLSTDFNQERKWKKAAAKKLAYAVAKVFEEKEAAKRRQMVEQEKKLKKIAHNIAKEVMKMWSGVEKVHKFKQESHLEERRRKLMDTHLNMIVGQTEQFSSWLAQGLSKTPKSSVMLTPSSQDGDVEFKPSTLDLPDDEETIAAAEEEEDSDVEEELADLKKQNEMDLNELIETLPPGMLEKKEEGSSPGSDYNASDDTSADDEETIAKAEAEDAGVSDNNDEIGDLEKEQDVPIEELIARYVKKRDNLTDSSGGSGSRSSEVESAEEESDVSDGEDADMEVSTPSSAKEIDIELGKLCSGASEVERNKTTTNKLKLPFLLRGNLREYQEVGLQWLVAMETRKLNGILADEMGLGKTMQTIALLAHLACFKGIWGPHLIIVPTSVLLNWDLEFKKWLPSFKVMSYYGSQKERREKRVGWTKPNTFHVCVTSYKLVIQDYRAFRSKKWYFLILHEAHNIKNFKSQRWQLLLNFNSQRRLLLTGTPLQNNLMELWSLMHFLMPSVFGSQSAFREWFGNPLVGMVEGTEDYNAHLVERLHKILRPFLLRRLKKEVELQLPKKTESVLMCSLSKRQRALYEEFLSRKDTRDTLSSGRFISVIGILMQLRKVCNHPDLFEEHGVQSPLALPPIPYDTPSLVLHALRSENDIDLDYFNFRLVDYESNLSAHSAHRTQQIKAHRLLIEEVNYKGVVPDNVLYSASSHSSFPPPRPPSPTLPPLPLLRQMPSLAPPRSTPPTSARSTPGATTNSTRSNPKSSPRPISSPRSLPSPRSVHYTSPNPLSLSSPRSDSSEPPPLMAKQVTRNPETREVPVGSVSPQSPASSNLIPAGYFRDPVSGVMLQLVEPGMPPPRRPPLGPPQLTNYTAKGNTSSKRGSMLPPTLAHSSCSSPEPHSLRTMSPRNTVETSPVKTDRRSDDSEERSDNSLALPSLEETRQAWRTSRRRMLADLNDMRCQRVPLYGSDLISTVSVKFSTVQHKTVQERMEELSPVIDRFVMCCDPISVRVDPVSVRHFATPLLELCQELTAPYHTVQSKLQMIMPETRLIQYDCGKLQRLDRLLSELKAGSHRALIFTQMTKVLDILERFLNYHGYRYLRLDGTTRVDTRLELMERFNADSKIFCMILSTRSGGVGVNLTGADTVIFYDSDWNPTMDAQAQDRCHRIGQTRDVHIYRLISASTIEENILKKANQKRLLGAVAIEEGNFTTAFFKKDNLSDIFGTSVVEDDPTAASPKHRTISKKDLEQVLADAEDAEDRSAAQRATTEQSQDMCDFDEDVVIEGEPPMSEAEKDMVNESKEFKQFEDEMKSIEDELTPLEQFALRFLEAENAENFSELLKQQEEDLTVPDTSLHDMQAAQEEQEYQDDLLLTYSMWDPQVILRKCKRKRRLAARQRREQELPSSSEHSSDEEYVRPVYVRRRENRYNLARIEAEKERLELELARCRRRLASAKRKCSARAAKANVQPGPSAVPRLPFPGRPLIPVLTHLRPVLSVFSPRIPLRSCVVTPSSSTVCTPQLTVKGPKRTYASRKSHPPATHVDPNTAMPSTSWPNQISSRSTIGQDHLLCQDNILRRQRNLTVNSNVPDTFTADCNLPKFFPTTLSYTANMNYSLPQYHAKSMQLTAASVYQQFNLSGMTHPYTAQQAMPMGPVYLNQTSHQQHQPAYAGVVDSRQPYQYSMGVQGGWTNNYTPNGIHPSQTPQTYTVSSAQTIRHHVPSVLQYPQLPSTQFQPAPVCQPNLQSVPFPNSLGPSFPPPSYESHANQDVMPFPSELEIMASSCPQTSVCPEQSSFVGQPNSSGVS